MGLLAGPALTGGFAVHGPPRTPGIPDPSDDGEGDNEISLQGWEIEIVGGEETLFLRVSLWNSMRVWAWSST